MRELSGKNRLVASTDGRSHLDWQSGVFTGKIKGMKKILGVLVIALLSTVAIRAAEFPDVGIKDLKAAIESKQVFLIDVNGSESWQEGHIPGAIDFEAKEAELAKLLPKDKNALIVAYCGGPKCTAYKEAATAAKKLGYKNVKHLSAGIAGWKSAGEKVEKGS